MEEDSKCYIDYVSILKYTDIGSFIKDMSH